MQNGAASRCATEIEYGGLNLFVVELSDINVRKTQIKGCVMDSDQGDRDNDGLRKLDFEWYPPKAQSNLKKHKVSFQEASTVFRDKKLLELPDREHSEEELRFIGVGRSDQDRLLFVNFTVRGDKVRIISARQAESWERREYEIANRYE